MLDFNPFSITTDALLFQWPELLKLKELEFRLVESEAHAKETSHGGINPIYSSNAVPKELIDFGEGKSLLEFTETFAKQLQQMTLNDDDSDSDSDSDNNESSPTNNKEKDNSTSKEKATTSDNK